MVSIKTSVKMFLPVTFWVGGTRTHSVDISWNLKRHEKAIDSAAEAGRIVVSLGGGFKVANSRYSREFSAQVCPQQKHLTKSSQTYEACVLH